MKIKLNYGKKGLEISLPDSWDVTVVRKSNMPVLPNPKKAVEHALNSPVGSDALLTIARRSRSACIAICDITRPVPNGLILPTVLDQLITGGIEPDNITILVATGLHRPNLGEELAEVVGDGAILDTVEVVNHYARRDEDHIDVGSTRGGTPIKLDKRFVDADLRVVVGLVEPHFMAGYSGGRKVVAPGLAHADTITRLHTAQFLEDCRARNCLVENNPLHLEQMEIISRIGQTLAVNVVIDDKRQLSFVNFGEVAASHLQAIAYARNYTEVSLPTRFPTVISSAAGYPLDDTYYQTIKGMVSAMDVMDPGGALFIASACGKGLGSVEYREAQTRFVRLGPEGFLQDIRHKRHAAVDEWQTEMQLRPMQVASIFLFSEGLSEDERALTGVSVVESLEESIAKWVDACGSSRVAVIPEGPYIVPLYRPEFSTSGA